MRSNLWDEVNQVYTAKLIMTPRSSMTCWELGSNQEACLNPDGSLIYDVIPVTENNKITGFMTKDKPFETLAIMMGWFVTRDTPISELVDLFVKTGKPAFFVFYRDAIVGILTPADLNKLPARTYIYALIGDVELMLSDVIRSESSISQNDILRKIGSKGAGKVQKSLSKLQSQNVDIDIIQLLYLFDLLTIVQETPILRERLGFSSRQKAEEGLNGINELRTKTMHLVKPVLSKMPDDLLNLQSSLARIESILSLKPKGISSE